MALRRDISANSTWHHILKAVGKSEWGKGGKGGGDIAGEETEEWKGEVRRRGGKRSGEEEEEEGR